MRNRHLALLAAGALLATTPALAQEHGPGDRHEDGPGPGGERRGGPGGPNRGGGTRPPQPPQAPAPPHADVPQGGRFGGGPGWNRPVPGGDARPDRPGGWGNGRPGGPDRGRPNNGWRGPNRGGPGGPDWRHDPGHDWRRYRENHGDLFHAPRYMPPPGFGYGYRPFAPGIRLQPFFYGRDYWLDDPAFYDLPPAYGPYRWVRYYNDVLLVDMRSGIVVDVIRSFFW